MTDWTLCWKCNTNYVDELVCCPKCKATNANVDLRTAEWEMWNYLTADLPPEVLE